MSFASQAAAGAALAKSWLDTYAQAREQAQLRRAQEEYEAGPQARQQFDEQAAAGLRAASETPGAQTIYDPSISGYRVQYAPGAPDYTAAVSEGLTVPQTEFRPRQYTEFMGREFAQAPTAAQREATLARRQSEIIGLRDPRAALQMRLAAAGEERAAAGEERAAQGFATQQREAGLRISAAERAATAAEGLDQASTALAEMRARGEPIDSAAITRVAAQYKVRPQELFAPAVQALGYDEAQAKTRIRTLQQDLSAAALKGPDGLNAFLAKNFDPDGSDGIAPTVMQTPKGYVVMYGDRQLPQFGAHQDITRLVGSVQGMIASDPLGTLNTLASIDAKAAEAEYRRSAASAQSALGDRYRGDSAYDQARTAQVERVAGLARIIADKPGTPEAAAAQRELAALRPPPSARAAGRQAPTGGFYEQLSQDPKAQADFLKELVGTEVEYVNERGETVKSRVKSPLEAKQVFDAQLRQERAQAAAPAARERLAASLKEAAGDGSLASVITDAEKKLRGMGVPSGMIPQIVDGALQDAGLERPKKGAAAAVGLAPGSRAAGAQAGPPAPGAGMNDRAQFDAETAEIEAGRRKAYTPELLERLRADETRRQAAALERQRQVDRDRARALGLTTN